MTCSTANTGCYLVYRGDPNDEEGRRANSNMERPWVEVEEFENVLSANDADEWLPNEMDDDQSVAEEWESQFEEDDEEMDKDEMESDQMCSEEDEDRDYMAFLETFRTKLQDEKDEMFSFPDSLVMNGEDTFLGKTLDFYEHIAGPDCRHQAGYHGHRITAQEMRGCKTLQYLVAKGKSWRPEPDDLEFELESHNFLSGISDYMPSTDSGLPRFVPQRHNLEYPTFDVHGWVSLLQTDSTKSVVWLTKLFRNTETTSQCLSTHGASRFSFVCLVNNSGASMLTVS
jgi:hypothetical protein